MAYTRQLCAKRFRRQINDFLHLRCLTYFNREVSCDLFRPSRDLFEINPRIHIPRRNQHQSNLRQTYPAFSGIAANTVGLAPARDKGPSCFQRAPLKEWCCSVERMVSIVAAQQLVRWSPRFDFIFESLPVAHDQPL